jgi:hypothetical protein
MVYHPISWLRTAFEDAIFTARRPTKSKKNCHFGRLPPYAEKAFWGFRNCYETQRARALLK